MTYRIRRSHVSDAPRLPAIERSAGDLFRTVPDLAWLADGDDLPVERHLDFIKEGASWVAEDDAGRILGFLCAELAGDAVHVWELSVKLESQRRGIGRALMAEAIAFARTRQLSSVTLTTFRDIAWNEPAYRRMGFETLQPHGDDPRLIAILAREVGKGFPGDRRCAMRLSLRPEQSS